RDFHVTGVQTCALPICFQTMDCSALSIYCFSHRKSTSHCDQTIRYSLAVPLLAKELPSLLPDVGLPPVFPQSAHHSILQRPASAAQFADPLCRLRQFETLHL